MKLDIQLYVEGQRLDLFEDESLQLTSSIQDIRSIDKIFSDYSQNFSVKASRNNNKIFKHYHDSSITNGYDARFRSDAVIEINHQPFRKGTIALTNVQMKNNRAYAYDLTFYGSTATLSNILGEDSLDSLTYLNTYNHAWNSTTVLQGLTSSGGVAGMVTGSVVYPLISPDQRFIYDSGVLEPIPKTRNVAKNTYPSIYAGVHQQDLKPAIKVKYIIDAIEDKYPQLTFSRDFFGDSDFTDLYLWLHRESGSIFKDASETRVLSKTFALDSSTINCSQEYVTIQSSSFSFTALNFSYNTVTCSAQLTVNPTGNEPYGIEIIDVNNSNELLFSASNLTGNSVNTIVLDGDGVSQRKYDIQAYIIKPEDSSISSVDVSWTTTTTRSDQYTSCTNIKNFSITSALSLLEEIIITNHLPDIKILDFLTGIFKMFNLTAYVDDSNVIVVKTLNNFYSEGTSYDITKYVGNEESSIKRISLYNEVSYSFKSPVTLLSKKFSELNGFNFGSETYKVVVDGKHIDGNKYSVDIPFEKLVYERLNDSDDGTLTNVLYGHFVDSSSNAVSGSPLLFYNIYTSLVGKPMYYKPYADNSSTYLNAYNRPSNVNASQTQTLNFDTENDEYALAYNEESLFKNYHSNYISSVFDFRNRMFNVTAILPLSIMTKYKLSDRFVINNVSYKINKITTNLLDNKSELELIIDL